MMVRGKIVVLAVSLLLVGVGLRLWLGRRPAPRPTKVSPPSTAVTKVSPETRQPSRRSTTPPSGVRLSRERLEALSRGPWGRDPFLTPDEEASLRSQARPIARSPAYLAPLEVKTILVSEGKRMAMINGHVVTEGDLIGDERVLEILPRAVVLGRGKSTRTVEMQFPAVPVWSTPGPSEGSGGAVRSP